MKKTLRIIFILFSVTGTTYSQSKEVHINDGKDSIFIAKEKKTNVDIRIPIMKAIGSSMDINELIKIKKNTALLFSVGVSFDEKGIVDTVYLSKVLSEEVTRILKPGAYVTKKVRERFKNFRGYKSTVVIFPVLVYDIKGGNLQYNHILLNDFIDVWPELDVDDKKKPLVLLDPFFNGFSPPVQ